MLTALTVAAVVCIASSNGGTTSQDLKTGYLSGPRRKAAMGHPVGAVTSALVIGLTMLALNAAGTHYTKKGFRRISCFTFTAMPRTTPGKPYDATRRMKADPDGRRHDRIPRRPRRAKANTERCRPGGIWWIDTGHPIYRTDVPISREAKTMDNGEDAPEEFTAPQPRFSPRSFEGILGGTLEWGLSSSAS